MTTDARSRATWRDSAATRVFGSFFGWFSLALAVVFLQTFVASGDLTGVFIGILFIAMGLAPLVTVLPAAPQRMILGRVDAQGRAFSEARPARAHLLSTHPPPEPGDNNPTIGDWALSLGLTLGATGFGVWLGVVWFGSVA